MEDIALTQINKLKKDGGVGYAELAPKAFLKETEFESAPSEIVEGMYDTVVGGVELLNAIGTTTNFTVLFDGIAYPCGFAAAGNAAFFGNLTVIGGDGVDTGEPFVGFVIPEPASVLFITADAGKHKIGIVSQTEKEETVHTIDKKYLPDDIGGSGGGLPVVEFETVATAEGQLLSFNDYAKLDAIGFALPCIWKCKIDMDGDEVPLTLLAQGISVETEGGLQYTASGAVDFGSFMGKYGVMIFGSPTGFRIGCFVDMPTEE